jgi:hypothetical protein
MMTFWNFLCDSCRNIKNKITNFYNHIGDYFSGHHDMWVFIPGHTAPISISNIDNSVQSSWLYDNSDASLKICTTSETALTTGKFSWLSASIRIYNSSKTYTDYNIDNYIEDFTLNTIDNIVQSGNFTTQYTRITNSGPITTTINNGLWLENQYSCNVGIGGKISGLNFFSGSFQFDLAWVHFFDFYINASDVVKDCKASWIFTQFPDSLNTYKTLDTV